MSLIRPLARVSCPLALALLAGCGGGGPSKAGDISGRYIVTISDADMAAPALMTGQLDPKTPGTEDTMTVITLPIQEPVTPFAQIPVSNSVIGPPNSLAVTRDGRTAFVVETRGPAPEGATSVRELPRGKKLYLIDLSDPLKPFVRDTVEVGNDESNSEPLSVDVSPAGDVVAVARKAAGEQIVMVTVKDGKYADAVAWTLQGIDDSSAAPSAIVWRPGSAGGRHFAVTLPDRDQVVFYEFRRHENGDMGLATWGPPVSVGRYPVSGAFTPDGRYFITTEAQWGKDVEGFNVGAPDGSVSVIRLSDVPTEEPAAEGQPVRPVIHQVVGSAPVGTSPQGIAVSPDGKLVATANLRRSFLPESDPRLTRGGSVSLLSLDPGTGKLTPAGEYAMDAMPVGLSFDSKGEFLVTTLFRSFDPNSSPLFGELGFWKVRSGGSPSLEKTDIYVGVGKGPHGVVIVR